MKKLINCTVGIYETQYTLFKNKNGDLTIKEPYIKWKNNTGSLSFTKTIIDSNNKNKEAILECFADNTMLSDFDGRILTLDELIAGY